MCIGNKARAYTTNQAQCNNDAGLGFICARTNIQKPTHIPKITLIADININARQIYMTRMVHKFKIVAFFFRFNRTFLLRISYDKRCDVVVVSAIQVMWPTLLANHLVACVE